MEQTPSLFFFYPIPPYHGIRAQVEIQKKEKNSRSSLLYPLRGLHLLRLVALWRGFSFSTHHSLSQFCLLNRHRFQRSTIVVQ